MKNMNGLKSQGGWWQIAAAAISIGSSLIGGNKAKKQAAQLAAANINLIKAETAEELRRMELTQNQVMGAAQANAAASGFEVSQKFGGTTDYENYFGELEDEYGARKKWTQKQSASRIRVAAAGGSAAKTQIGNNQRSDIINAVTTAVNTWE